MFCLYCWRTIKRLEGTGKRQESIMRLKTDNGFIEDKQEIAEFLNEHFTTVADRLRSLLPDVCCDLSKLRTFVASRIDKDVKFTIPPMTTKHVLGILKDIQANKSTGIDNIGAKILKIAAPALAPSITKIINLSLSSGIFPSRWKIAKVTPIFKDGERDDVKNFRPISVLPVMSKIIEKHVHKHVYTYMSRNSLLYSKQSGFRCHHSTETALIKIIDQLLFELDNNRVTGMVTVDYQKAFDMLDHSLLLLKLKIYGFDENAIAWTKSYLHQRKQCVQLSGARSTMREICHGIPQGSILRPLFFIIFINDLPLHIGNAELDLYADDTTISKSADYKELHQLIKSLEESVVNVQDWAAGNKMPLNEKKTKFLLITGKRLASMIGELSPPVPQDIKRVSSTKLLDLVVDDKLSFNEHIDYICGKLAKRIGILKRIRNCLSVNQRQLYYNAIIKPVMMYGSITWSICSKANQTRVLQLQKRAARVILDSSRLSPSVELFNKLGWLPFYEEIKVNKCSLTYKRVNGEVPSYIFEALKLNSQMHARNTRHANLNLICPKVNRKTEGGKMFSVTVAQLWNSLSLNLRRQASVSLFRKKFEKLLLDEQKFLVHFCP